MDDRSTNARVVAVHASGASAEDATRHLGQEQRLTGLVPSDGQAASAWGVLVLDKGATVEEIAGLYPRSEVIVYAQAHADAVDRHPRLHVEGVALDPLDLLAERSVEVLMETVRGMRAADDLVRRQGWRPTTVGGSLVGATVELWGHGVERDRVITLLQGLGCSIVGPGDDHAAPGDATDRYALVLPSARDSWSATVNTDTSPTRVATVDPADEAPTSPVGSAAIRRAVARLLQHCPP